MHLIYIYHSGFALLADGLTIIIDFYKDSLSTEKHEGIVHDEILNRPGKLYVLATHFHPDHFNKHILEWRKQRPDISYIFSYDILNFQGVKAEDGIFLNKGDEYKDDNIRIEAFGSTDIGVSYLINLQGKTIFHAGDLNNWQWSEFTEADIQKAGDDFLAEVDFIQKRYPKIDLVMFPVDQRLGKDYMKGPTQFVERIKTCIFAPMHFGRNYDGGNAFQPIAEANGCRFLKITQQGETFDI